ncbi:hypothetical protein, conserved [Eimeria necatrix]|uniref:Uncharacterized protein n=1 Tax=Eimeria necatrix TaxID=51315 RepID=U6MG07_9EIME|nr:hypothetical protein, conserved [Eimeria necatrix]CDJ63172.1 hypothetical protein, conserved [Eimeria necatrix]
MGRGDFPYLLQQWLRSCIDSYRSTSLYHRNLGFFFVGIFGGAVWGKYKRHEREARNADCATVHLMFYKVPNPPLEQRIEPATRGQSDTQSSFQTRRKFEKLWEEGARLLQRQPGYTYTQMFRKLASDEIAQAGAADLVDADFERRSGGRKGIGAGLEASRDGGNAEKDRHTLDYVELRVWEDESFRQKAQAMQQPYIEKMLSLGVRMYGGLYRRVFDDALVRLIQ